MTTTSQQPPADEPGRAGRTDSGRAGGGARSGDGQPGNGWPGNGRRGALSGAFLAVAVVVVVAVAAIAWFFLAGPGSSSARAEREVEQTLQDMSAAESFADFNSYMCAESRVPQELVDTITASGEQTGTDVDSMFRESLAGSFPEDLQVTGVEFSEGGAEAVATVESGSGDAEPEQVRMRDEDGDWKLCQPGVGMGAVPDSAPGEQPG